jgi:hypothetical protein
MARRSKISSASASGMSRTKTPRFFSCRTRPASSSMRKASRTGPRDTPSRVGQRGFGQLGAGRQFARQDQPFELLLHHEVSELDCSRAMVGCSGRSCGFHARIGGAQIADCQQ